MSDNTKDDSLPYGCQNLDNRDIEAVTDVLNSSFLTTGPSVEAFETELCQLTGAEYAVVCSNGTAALHLACMAAGVSNLDLGVTSPISFLASANCIEYCKGQVDFIDIDPVSLCLSLDALDLYCREKNIPKIVIPVDFAGTPADLSGMKLLSEKYGFLLIEDAAHALGSTYESEGKSYACGSCVHTDMAIFSFHPVKTVTTGEGGAVMTNDATLANRLRKLRNHGMDRDKDTLAQQGGWYYEMTGLGFNYRLTDIQCALGISQIAKLEEFKKKRQRIVSEYNNAFCNRDDLILPPKDLQANACPHLYPIRIKKGDILRRKVYEKLREDHIFCQIHYIPIYWQPYYVEKYGYKKGKCPIAETYYDQTLSLPLFPGMTESDVERVIDRFLIAVGQ